MRNVNFMGISLYEMQICVTVAKYKSITKAAAELYSTQPVLSKKITQIEDELGIILFIRGKNTNLRPTPAGQLLCTDWSRILNEFRSSFNNATKIQKNKDERIIVATTPSAQTNIFISPVVAEFRRIYPEVELRVDNGSIRAAKEYLNTGMVDILLVNSFLKELFETEEFNWQMVLSCPWSVGMLRTNPLAQKESLTFEDLKTQQFIIPQNNSFIQKVRHMCEEHGFSPSVSYYASHFLRISNCISNKNEVFLTDRFLQDYYNENCVYFDLPDARSGVMMVTRKHETNGYVEDFKRIAQKVFRDLDQNAAEK